MRNQRGFTMIGLAVVLTLVAAVVYVVAIHATPYIRDYQIGRTVKQAARNATDLNENNQRQVTIYLARKIAEMSFPLTVEDFKIEFDHNDVKVSVAWDYEVVVIPENDFIPPYSRHLSFYHEAIEPIKR